MQIAIMKWAEALILDKPTIRRGFSFRNIK